MQTTAKQTKRILTVEVRRMDDSDPDTSWLGEYSNRPAEDYSIDREHSLDCPLNNPHVVDQLERISSYLDKERRHAADLYEHYGRAEDSQRYDDLEQAQEIVLGLQECDCGEEGDRGRNEYRYFNTSGNYSGESLEDIVQYTKQDYARMEGLQRGDWGFIGVDARAKVVVGGTQQTVTSGGLWGIESDSEDGYLEEEERNQLAELRTVLYEMGFSKRAIAAAVKQAGM